MSARRVRLAAEVNAPQRILRVQADGVTLDLEGFSNESVYVAIDKAASIAAFEGWRDWRLIEGVRVLVTGDEHGPR